MFELILPPELEEKLVKEAIEEERTIDPETGELREPEEPEIDPEKLAEYEDQIGSRDVTPDRLRPDRRADREAGDPAADPRGRARHDVRGVPATASAR